MMSAIGKPVRAGWKAGATIRCFALEGSRPRGALGDGALPHASANIAFEKVLCHGRAPAPFQSKTVNAS